MGTVLYPSGVGIRIPTSGQLIGLATGVLRLKGFIKESEAITSKTAERYYRGERVEAESVGVILDAIIAPLLAEHLVDPDAFGENFDATAWARSMVEDFAARWDRLAATMSSGHFPIVSEVDSPLPFMRLVALDLGLRWGAYQALRASLGREPIFKPAWLAQDALRVAMDEIRSRKIPKNSLEKLAADVLVSLTTMEAWRTGASLPSELNLDGLAGVLAVYTGGEKDPIKAQLRLAVGVSAAWHRLAQVVSHEGHPINLVNGFEAVAKRAFAFFKWLPLTLDEAGRIEAIWVVVISGARAPAGSAACKHLESLAERRQEVAADLRALPGEWSDRINYWFQMLGGVDSLSAKLAAQTGQPLPEALELTRMAIAHTMTMGDFDQPVSDFKHSYIVTGDNRFKAMNRRAQADRAQSPGDYRTALDHIERAIGLEPHNPSHRRAMGAWLGELIEDGQIQFLNLALTQLQEALRLDPTDKVAATEIGVVLCNAGLLEDAEQAFVDVERISADWHHFHEVRGINLAWLRRFDEAEACLRRAVELDANGVNAKRYLALALMKLRRKGEAEKLAREIQHRSGESLLDRWEMKLQQRPNASVRWTRTPDGWVPALP